jgi:hypothetical protein
VAQWWRKPRSPEPVHRGETFKQRRVKRESSTLVKCTTANKENRGRVTNNRKERTSL